MVEHFEVGGDSVKNFIPVMRAKRLLEMKSYIDNDNEIVLNTVEDAKNKVIKSSELIEIIEARMV